MSETADVLKNEGVAGQAAGAPWDRIAFGPATDWADAEDGAEVIAASQGEHRTLLRWERRVDLDTGRSFHATSVRLETSIGVQHDSQWSLELDARTERLTLHWLRVVRGGRVVDHLRRECMRLLQRETEMERLILSGRWTLLAVLDDVRVGDVIEAGYSYDMVHPIRGKGCEVFFAVPPQAIVGRWCLMLRGAEARWAGLRWKTSDDAPVPVAAGEADGRRRLTWTGSQPVPREAEPNVPGTCLDYTWVQVSDLAKWTDLAVSAAAAWARAGDVAGLDDEPALAKPEPVDAAAINGLVKYLQEHYRYLSLDLQAGGWVPSAPGAVARRRHGDCKDLAWLAATVLRRWGVEARSVLVGTGFRERVAEMLPMAMAFNHAILEVTWDGRTRWYDLTERGQGGDFDGRAVGWFGVGLPVDTGNNELRAQPGTKASGVYAWREVILLDTRAEAASLTEQQVRAEGWQADALRGQRASLGPELFAKEREEMAKRRFGRARRVGVLQWRDDPVANVCEIAEAFEFTEELASAEASGRVVYHVPPCLPVMWFGLPEEKVRRLPWAMPCPLEVRHRIEVRSTEKAVMGARRRRWDEPEFEAASDSKGGAGGWTWTYRMVVKQPEVAAARVADYRKQLAEFFAESGWRLTLPRGRARPRRGAGFGELATPADATETARADVAALSGEESEEAKAELARLAREAKLGRGEPMRSSGRSTAGAEVGARGVRRRRSERMRASGGGWTEKVPAGAFNVIWVIFVFVVLGVARGCFQGGP